MPLMFLYALIILFVFFIGAFILTQIKTDKITKEMMWPLGLVILSVGLLTLLRLQGYIATWSHFWMVVLTGIWGVRLAYFLYKRNKRAGNAPHQSASLVTFLKITGLQYIVALPITTLFAFPKRDGGTLMAWLLFISVLVWIFGFVFEVVSDQQLRNFKKRPEMEGRILKTGLWKYSRHPNYFGEALMWWGLGLIALSTAQMPWALLGILSPALVTVMLLYVWGVPRVEHSLMKNEEYQAYASYTSVFIPRKPKK